MKVDFTKYEALIHQTLMKLNVQCIEDRRDLCQNIYIRLLRSDFKYEHEGGLIRYIQTSTKNEFINSLRKRKLNVLGYEMSPRQLDKKLYQNKKFDTIIIEENAPEKDSLIDRIYSIGLSKNQQQIFDLYFISELQMNEIADLMSIPEGTVKGALHRIRKTMQPHLKDYAKKEFGITPKIAI